MMTKLLIMLATLLNFGDYQTEKLPAREGDNLEVVLFGHASLALVCNDKVIYIDLVGSYADYGTLPKVDVVLITHNHGDHFDKKAIADVSTSQTVTIANSQTAEGLKGAQTMRNGESKTIGDWLKIEAVAAYNTTEGHTQFHPKGRDNGYVITACGKRIYVCGDSEPTPEMKALKNIDYAFLPVNQPYTMTVEQAVEAVKAIRPTVFYPYHFGGSGTPTDMEQLRREVEKEGLKIKIFDRMK